MSNQITTSPYLSKVQFYDIDVETSEAVSAQEMKNSVEVKSEQEFDQVVRTGVLLDGDFTYLLIPPSAPFVLKYCEPGLVYYSDSL